MKIAIAGAGIGGLTTALCLAKAGYDVQLIEKAKAFSDIGAGLQCGANALRVFQYLGLEAELEKKAVQPEAIHFRQHDSGNTLYRSALGDSYAEKYGAPYFHLHRADLQAVLVAAVKELPNVEIRLGTSIDSFTESQEGVNAILNSGEYVFADCLIGADGIKSRLREQVIGRNSLRFSGSFAWRAMVPTQNLPSDFMSTVVTNFVGPKKHIVLYYVRDKQLLNIVGVVEDAVEGGQASDGSWVQTAPWQEFRRDFDGWHPMVTKAIDAVNKEQCYRWALHDHAPLAKWGTGRMALLGDAAHAMLPFMASGAAMAIEDARILQRCLSQEQNIEQALLLYQRNRIQRTRYVQNTSSKLGKIYHLKNLFAQNAAFAVLKMVGGKKEAFLPEYDANTVELN